MAKRRILKKDINYISETLFSEVAVIRMLEKDVDADKANYPRYYPLLKRLLKPGGLFVLEHGKKNHFEAHPCFIEHRSYGSVNFSFFGVSADSEQGGE